MYENDATTHIANEQRINIAWSTTVMISISVIIELVTYVVVGNAQLKQRLKTTTPYRVMNIRIVLPYIDFVALNVAIFKSVFAFPLDAPVDSFTADILPRV